ncbi:hypothetical protein J437_LFUL001335, partial [Ladona fulva]
PVVENEGINLGDANADNATKTPEINLDYILKITMHELQRGPGSEVEVCLAIVSVAFQRVWRVEKKRRSFPMASRIFNVVANAEMISSEVELVEPVFGGRAKIESGCYDSMETNKSSCIIDLDVSLNPTISDSSEEARKGVVDFNILSYGYSHISQQSLQNELEEETQFVPNFPDRTRRGKRMLEYIPGENLTVLKLPKNRWSTLDAADMKFYPKLEVLDLSKNVFETFDTETFKESIHLKELYFSENHLRSIPGLIANQSDLRVLNIGGNIFDYDEDSGVQVLVGYISNQLHMEKLNISGFRTKILLRDTFPLLPELKELYASQCGVDLVEKNAFLNVFSLEKIDLSSNSLNSLPHDVFFPLKHLKSLDLSFNKFTNGLGLLFSSQMDLLDMSSNFMSSAEDLIAHGSKVRRINLANNVLRYLKELKINTADDGALVEELDLSSNLIPALSLTECNTLSTLKQLNLSENQFNCDDCNLLDFQYWLNQSDSSIFTSPPEDFLCAAPPLARKSKTRVIDAEYNKDCIGPDVLIISGGTFSGLALLIALICGICYLYRFEISYILHLIKVKRRSAKGEGKPHSECIYDAFVSYSGHDRNWVLRVLQPYLEEGEDKYQLCLHDRNFTLGGIISQNIIESIEKSRKTILILSKGFVDSQWCRWEMEMANHKLFHDSRDFLVLVELNRLDRRDLPRHLRFLMETRTYLEWPSQEKNRESSDDTGVELSHHSSNAIAAKIYEQSVNVFWKRLREALGESLYIKEQKARKEVEIAVRKSRMRDDGNFVVYRRTLEKPVEEAEL